MLKPADYRIVDLRRGKEGFPFLGCTNRQRGSNYFRTGNAEREFHRIDEYAYGRLVRWMHRRGGQRTHYRRDAWPRERLHDEMGLHRLRGTVRYPAQATPQRPSESRVRELRTHGLKGGSGDGVA